MPKEYRMEVTVESGEDCGKAFREILDMAKEEGLPAEPLRDAGSKIGSVVLFVQQDKERDIAGMFLMASRNAKNTVFRIDYEERESGAYGYGVLQDGEVLDSFMGERQERASPNEEELRNAIAEQHRSFDEAIRGQEIKIARHPGESVYLVFGGRIAQRLFDCKVREITEEKVQTFSKAEEAYGAHFRRLAPEYGSLGSEKMEKLDEEIAFSMLRMNYRPKHIANAVKNCSPKAQVFVKTGNRATYAKEAVKAAHKEISRCNQAR